MPLGNKHGKFCSCQSHQAGSGTINTHTHTQINHNTSHKNQGTHTRSPAPTHFTSRGCNGERSSSETSGIVQRPLLLKHTAIRTDPTPDRSLIHWVLKPVGSTTLWGPNWQMDSGWWLDDWLTNTWPWPRCQKWSNQREVRLSWFQTWHAIGDREKSGREGREKDRRRDRPSKKRCHSLTSLPCLWRTYVSWCWRPGWYWWT